jgi:hypothetical protein
MIIPTFFDRNARKKSSSDIGAIITANARRYIGRLLATSTIFC